MSNRRSERKKREKYEPDECGENGGIFIIVLLGLLIVLLGAD